MALKLESLSLSTNNVQVHFEIHEYNITIKLFSIALLEDS